MTAEWLQAYLRQPRLLGEAEPHMTGAVGQQRLPATYLAELPIPLPPLAEQRRLAAILAERLAAVERAHAAAQAQLAAAQGAARRRATRRLRERAGAGMAKGAARRYTPAS